MRTQDFLFELGCEELPTSALKQAGTDLLKLIESELSALGLPYADIQGIASPRRLGCLIKGLASEQADQEIVLRGPSQSVAYDADGQPTKALLGFCKKNGIQPEQLSVVETPKGPGLEYRGVQTGHPTADLIPDLLSRCITKLPLPKKMRWGSTRQEFTRPVLWLVVMLDDQVVPCGLFDRQSATQTRGHRVHSPDWIEIPHASDYFELLRANRVIASFAERRTRVAELAAGVSVAGEFTVIATDDLVDEVCALVEWPVPLMGTFSTDFLDVPPRP